MATLPVALFESNSPAKWAHWCSCCTDDDNIFHLFHRGSGKRSYLCSPHYLSPDLRFRSQDKMEFFFFVLILQQLTENQLIYFEKRKYSKLFAAYIWKFPISISYISRWTFLLGEKSKWNIVPVGPFLWYKICFNRMHWIMRTFSIVDSLFRMKRKCSCQIC